MSTLHGLTELRYAMYSFTMNLLRRYLLYIIAHIPDLMPVHDCIMMLHVEHTLRIVSLRLTCYDTTHRVL